MPGTDTPRLFQGAFRQLNKFFVVISVNLYLTRGHYISVGRKGTGKSTIFLKLENEYRKKSGYLPCYIDVKTIFESAQAQSTYADYLADYMDRETLNKYLMTRSFIQSVLSVIYSEVDKQRKSFFQKVAGAIVGNSDEKIKEKIKILREKVDNNEEFKKNRTTNFPTL